MQTLSLKFKAPGLTIPLNYHHPLQSMIFNLLYSVDNAPLFHDEGFHYGNYLYKLFTFSLLRGQKEINQGKITFRDLIHLDIRSIRSDFCAKLREAVRDRSFATLCGQTLNIDKIAVDSAFIADKEFKIHMLSPLTIHKRREDGEDKFLTPLDRDFREEINLNFKRKYAAFYGEEPAGDIQISVDNINSRDKYVTKFKAESHITGWFGDYTIAGKPEYLNFLYYVGLGDNTSAGFGMFEVI
jgi:CRISPR-associated endoribonuclease Cas6